MIWAQLSGKTGPEGWMERLNAGHDHNLALLPEPLRRLLPSAPRVLEREQVAAQVFPTGGRFQAGCPIGLFVLAGSARAGSPLARFLATFWRRRSSNSLSLCQEISWQASCRRVTRDDRWRVRSVCGLRQAPRDRGNPRREGAGRLARYPMAGAAMPGLHPEKPRHAFSSPFHPG